MTSDFIFLAVYFGLSCYFFYRLQSQKNNRGFNGFGAGVFLMIFLFKLAPVLANLAKKTFF
jgi:hypothetical protein